MALLFAGSMALGIWLRRTTVPYWDMWGAYLGFYTHSGEGWDVWWRLHMEHRPVLARLLFWIDLRFFHGSMTLLYVLNAVLPLLIVACLVFLLRRTRCPDAGAPCTAQVALVALLVVLATSWVQNENFFWAFQSQFWLAYLLPLLSFTLLAHAQATGRRASFWLAALAGLLSAGTMANGTLALPLLTAQALLARMRWRDVGVLLIAAALTLILYRHGYQPELAAEQPDWLRFAGFVLVFLGSLWHFLLHTSAMWPAMAAGAAWIALALAVTVRVLRQRPMQPYAVALLMLLAYIGAAALAIAYGRVRFGLGQPFAPRYATPELMAWAVLLLLATRQWPRALASRWALGAYAIVPLLLLSAQKAAIRVPGDYLIGLRMPALAIQLDVRDVDTEAFKHTYPVPLGTFDLAEQAKREHLAVFGEPDMRLAARHWAGEMLAAQPQARCAGAVQAVEAIPGVSNALRVRGWLYDPAQPRAPSLVLLAGPAGSRGAALGAFQLRDPVAPHPLNSRERNSGFNGYIQTPQGTDGDPATVTLTGWVNQQPVCTLTLDLPHP